MFIALQRMGPDIGHSTLTRMEGVIRELVHGKFILAWMRFPGYEITTIDDVII
jgi:hypothetical protein